MNRPLLYLKGFVLTINLALLLSCPASAADSVLSTSSSADEDPHLQMLYEKLNKLGQLVSSTKDPAETAAYSLQQADVLDQIAVRSRQEDVAPLLRQMADYLYMAVLSSSASDRTAHFRLVNLGNNVWQRTGDRKAAAYVRYRAVQGDYAARLSSQAEEGNALPEQLRRRLAEFVEVFPDGEDTPTALLELGMVCETLGKESEARLWYQSLILNHADNPLALKARGALQRLDLMGKPFCLTLPRLSDGDGRIDAPFDIEEFRGRVVVVYFWASWDQRCAADFAKLKQFLDRQQKQGIELVCVNLDNGPDDALAFLRGVPAPGVQVFQRGGLEGRIATRYGILSLPRLLILSKNGTMVERGTDVESLESKVRQLMR